MKNKIIKFDINSALNLHNDLAISLDENANPFSGFTFSPVSMPKDAPHAGEMHPNGDEVVYVMSGLIEVTLEFEHNEIVRVEADEGIIIPKGIWHRIHVIEPAKLLTISSGPGFEYRAL